MAYIFELVNLQYIQITKSLKFGFACLHEDWQITNKQHLLHILCRQSVLVIYSASLAEIASLKEAELSEASAIIKVTSTMPVIKSQNIAASRI